jgi:hypothetical protein
MPKQMLQPGKTFQKSAIAVCEIGSALSLHPRSEGNSGRFDARRVRGQQGERTIACLIDIVCEPHLLLHLVDINFPGSVGPWWNRYEKKLDLGHQNLIFPASR